MKKTRKLWCMLMAMLVLITSLPVDTYAGTGQKLDNVLSITCDGFVYDGIKTASPQVTQNASGATVYFTYYDDNNVAIGTNPPSEPGNYKVTADTFETADYNSAEATATFTIDKAESLSINFPTSADGLYAGQLLSYSTLHGGSTQYGTFEWVNPNKQVDATDNDVTPYEIVFRPNEKTLKCYKTVTPLEGTMTLSVERRTIDNFSIDCVDVYQGESLEPTTISGAGANPITYEYKLLGSSDSTYTSEKPTAPGNYVIRGTIPETNIYHSATATCNASIRFRPSQLNVTCANVSYGEKIQPSMRQNTNGQEVKYIYFKTSGPIEDPTVSYMPSPTDILLSVPTEPGYYGVIEYIEPNGVYGGASGVAYFQIKKADLNNLTYQMDTNPLVYNGSAQNPQFTIKNGSTVLKNGTDYTVTYNNNVNIGTATATITGIGDHYTGTIQKTFAITEKNVANLAVNLSAYSYIYTGKEKKPTVTVMDGNKVLKKGTDYTVTYSGNKNPGTASVTVTGKGIYTGSVTKTFSIQPIAVTMQAVAANKAATVSWSKSGGSTGYAIYMSTKKKGTYTQVKTVKSSVKSFKQKGLKKGKTYYFKVRAYKDTKQGRVYGVYSSIQSVKVK